MSETGIEVTMQGPLADPAQARVMAEHAAKSALTLVGFMLLLYWWANR